jgi:hypothetical protein
MGPGFRWEANKVEMDASFAPSGEAAHRRTAVTM